MECPSCSCSTYSEVTIDSGRFIWNLTECEHCKYVWLQEGANIVLHMHCPKCLNTSVDAILSQNDHFPCLLCSACGSKLTAIEN